MPEFTQDDFKAPELTEREQGLIQSAQEDGFEHGHRMGVESTCKTLRDRVVAIRDKAEKDWIRHRNAHSDAQRQLVAGRCEVAVEILALLDELEGDT